MDPAKAIRFALGIARSAHRATEKPLTMARGGMPSKEEGAIADFIPPKLQGTQMTAYHGTPHTFPGTAENPLGEFDPTKIGTGEGAQAYGHGLYLAEAPEVAKGYAVNLANRDMRNQGRLNAHANAKRLVAMAGDPKYAADDIRFALDVNPDHPQKELLNQTLSMLESGEYKHPLKDEGRLYHVHVPDEMVERMLDWDKPLSEQHPHVQKSVQSFAEKHPEIADYLGIGRRDLSGHDLYNPLGGIHGDQAASKMLHEHGIPGIKYFDQNSRIKPPVTLDELKSRLSEAEETLPKLKGFNFNTDNHEKLIDSLRNQIANYKTIYPDRTRNFVIFPGAEKHLKILKREARGGYIGKTSGGPIVDPQKAIRRAMMVAKQAGGSLSGGLEFPQEEAEFRLKTKKNREAAVASGKKQDVGRPKNPRTVVRPPSGSENMPHFVAGDLTFKDWIKRHESILTPAEITNASRWYKDIYKNFLIYTNHDSAKSKKMMRAWLVAQQNTSPATAMQNVLLQREQMSRGVPKHLWRAGGMPNPTEAARAVLADQPITGGVGQKISDFVDSAEGKNSRSWYGNHPEGGSPFVIDVHSARDTGLVDQELINHLSRLGYNKDDLAKLSVDMKASPSDAQYENRAQWGRDLTKHLNKIKWMGKSDWRPEEIQAVGWMGLTKLTRNAEEDSASGLERNLRRVSYELAPGENSPWHHKYASAIEGLPDEDRYRITDAMTNSALGHATKLAGVDVHSLVHGTGAWEQNQNPAAVAQSLSTETGADILSNALGHLLHQTEVWHNRIKPVTKNPGGFAIDFVEKNSKNLADRKNLKDFWENIMAADKSGLIRGYQPITLPTGEVGVRALVDKGGKGIHSRLEEVLHPNGELGTMLSGLPFDVEARLHEAEISKFRNDWKENPHGQVYLSRLNDLLGSDPSAYLHSAGSQLEKELEGHLNQAYARQGRSWTKGSTQEAPGEIAGVKKAFGGEIDEKETIYGKQKGSPEVAGMGGSLRPEEGEVSHAGRMGGGAGFLPAQVQAFGPQPPLEGLPREVAIPGRDQPLKAGPNLTVRDLASSYMRSLGKTHNPPKKYLKADPNRAKRIADAYAAMKHEPNHPLVKAAYDQLAKETMAQYRHAINNGYKFEFWDPSKQNDPYEASPRLAVEDINRNKHMYVFPTRFGFGSDEEMKSSLKDNPLLADSGEVWNGHPVTVNDIFRAVHDLYGHAHEGVGFRADGEENAWRSHAAMFSPLARAALTSETRGQNSWLNFGPHGEHNRSARTEDTHFADQKIGLLPAWAMHEGAEDFTPPDEIKEINRVMSAHKKTGGIVEKDPSVDKALMLVRKIDSSLPKTVNLAREVLRGRP